MHSSISIHGNRSYYNHICLFNPARIVVGRVDWEASTNANKLPTFREFLSSTFNEKETHYMHTHELFMFHCRVETYAPITNKIHHQERRNQHLVSIPKEELKKKDKRKAKKHKREEIESTESTEKGRKEIKIVDEFETTKQLVNEEKNLEDHVVEWNGGRYVLINAVSSKSDIANYYYPRFHSKYPDRVCKWVLERQEYKKLARTNPHIQIDRSRTWRISIFSFEFYEFVKKECCAILSQRD